MNSKSDSPSVSVRGDHVMGRRSSKSFSLPVLRNQVREDRGKHPIDHQRPKTRGDCEHGPRPCPYVGCKHHLYLDVLPSGKLRINFPGVEPTDLAHSCALDPQMFHLSPTEVGRVMNVTKEAVEQIETRAIGKIATAINGRRTR